MKSLLRVCLAPAVISFAVGCDLALPPPSSDSSPAEASSPDTRQPTVSPEDFAVLSHSGRWDDRLNILEVIGEVRNNGTVAAGPKVEAIARDVNGTLIDSASFWPASISNIPPGETRGFHYPLTRDRRAVTVSARVVSVDVWD